MAELLVTVPHFVVGRQQSLRRSTAGRRLALLEQMRSERFALDVVITDHAKARMQERGIDEVLLALLIETGELKRTIGAQSFIFRNFEDRHDNLVCAAVAEEEKLVVKTVMINWTLRETT
jgi:hypothetical protein